MGANRQCATFAPATIKGLGQSIKVHVVASLLLLTSLVAVCNSSVGVNVGAVAEELARAVLDGAENSNAEGTKSPTGRRTHSCRGCAATDAPASGTAAVVCLGGHIAHLLFATTA